jgi:hypothetical protein
VQPEQGLVLRRGNAKTLDFVEFTTISAMLSVRYQVCREREYRGTMHGRLLIAGSAAAALIAGLSVALAAEGSLDRVSLGGTVPVAKLNVPCAQDAFGAANGDACGPASDALFPQALASSAPIAALSATPSSGNAAIKLTDDLNMNFAGTSLAPVSPSSFSATNPAPFSGSILEEQSRPLEEASFAGVSWNVAPWASLSMIAAQSTANDPFDRDAISSLTKSSQSLNAGASARLGDNWVTTVSYGQGVSQLNLRSVSLLGDDDLLHSHALGLSIAKRGLFGNNDSLDIGITRKLQSYTANIDLTGNDGFDPGPFAKGNGLTVPETDFEVGYVTTFLDGALALQANAGYQTNVAGQNGQNALTVLSRAKFNF